MKKRYIFLLLISIIQFLSIGQSKTDLISPKPEIANSQNGIKAIPLLVGNEKKTDKPRIGILNENYTAVYTSNAPPSNISRTLNTDLPVGKTQYKYFVDKYGEANYSVPIVLPPGTRNMVPNLSIVYNSNLGDGLLGYGWDIGGIQSITRKGQTIYYNGQVQGISLTNNDWFALDGNALIPTSGNNGENGTTYGTEEETYNQIISYGTQGNGPEYFIVHTKSGLTIELGHTNSSSLILSGANNTVFKWMVDKISDNFGNYISFAYNNSGTECYISEIDYTGNAAWSQPYNSIVFNYSVKTDNNILYCAQGQLTQTFLLDNITINCENNLFKEYFFKYYFYNVSSFLNEIDEKGSDNSFLNSTQFCYTEDDGTDFQSQVSNLTNPNTYFQQYTLLDFNGDGKTDLVNFNASIITGNPKPNYENNAPYYWQQCYNWITQVLELGGPPLMWQNWNLQQNSTSTFPSATTFNTITTYTSFPAGFEPVGGAYPISQTFPGNLMNYSMDFNGDGLEDLAMCTTSNSNVGEEMDVYPYLSSGNGFTAPANPLQCYLNLNNNSNTPSTIQFLDLDGDGRMDVLNFYKNASGTYTLNIFFQGSLNHEKTYTLNTITHYDFSQCVEVDLNGDSKAELVNIADQNGNNNYIFSWNGDEATGTYTIQQVVQSGFKYITNAYYSDYINNHNYSEVACLGGPFLSLYGDFNGDGITDVIQVYPTQSLYDNNWNLYLGQGAGYYAPYISLNSIGFSSTPWCVDNGPPPAFYLAHDVNGDGKTDILEFIPKATSTQVNVFYSMGTTFSEVTYTIPDVITQSTDQIDFGDFNGDGVDDLFYYNTQNNGGQPTVFYFYTRARSKRLKEAVDGYNKKITFYYNTLSAGCQDADNSQNNNNNNQGIARPPLGNTNNSENTYNNCDIYTQNSDKTQSYPLRDYMGPIYAVTMLTTPDSTGNSVLTKDTGSSIYQYSDAIVHLQGKDFLGFLNILQKSKVYGLNSSSEYSIDNTYYKLNISQSNLTNSSNAAVSTETYNTTDNNVGGIRYSTLLNENNIYFAITNGNISTSYTYDSYGNITDLNKVISYNNNVIEGTDISKTFVQKGAWIPSLPQTVDTTRVRPPVQIVYGRQINYWYDNSGLLVTDATDQNNVQIDNFYTYIGQQGVLEKQVTSSQDANNIILPERTTTWQYDTYRRFPVSVTNSLNQSWQYTYDDLWGKPLTETTPNNLTTYYYYDGYGKLTKMETPDLISTYYTYSWVPSGYLPQPGDPIDVSQTSLYSIYKQIIDDIQLPCKPAIKTYYDWSGHQTRTETNGFANLLYTDILRNSRGDDSLRTGIYETVQNSSYSPTVSTCTYNYLNLPIGISENVPNKSDPTLDTTISYSYPGDGSITVNVTNPEGNTTSKTVDASGLLTKVTDAQGNYLTLIYDPTRQIYTTSLNGGNDISTMLYDDCARPGTLIEMNSNVTYYSYNQYNELDNSTDANGNYYTYTYDALGRIITKQCANDGNYSYTYVNSGNGLNKIQSQNYTQTNCNQCNSITYNYTYDNLDRLTQEQEIIDNGTYDHTYQYDINNNIIQETFPDGYTISNSYTVYGYMNETDDVTNGGMIWNGTAMNPFGQYISYNLGNNISTDKTYTNYDYPSSISAQNVEYLNLSFDPYSGNLTNRQDNVVNLSESFQYDNLDRLTRAQVTGQSPVTITYSALGNGNFNNNSNIGNYSYNNPQLNQVEDVINSNNVINNNIQSISYTPFSKASSITQGNFQLSINYGPDQQRKFDILNSSQTGFQYSRTYIGDFEELIDANQTNLHYIYRGGNLVAIYTNGSITPNMYYIYTDHLNSILTVTNNTGNIVTQQNFDPWGNYRNPATWTYSNIPNQPDWLYRGFCSHEHLPQFQLINMNGRIYDPSISAFVSPDIMVQDPFNIQDYNRYSYCSNNPLKYIDASGYSFLSWMFGSNSIFGSPKRDFEWFVGHNSDFHHLFTSSEWDFGGHSFADHNWHFIYYNCGYGFVRWTWDATLGIAISAVDVAAVVGTFTLVAAGIIGLGGLIGGEIGADIAVFIAFPTAIYAVTLIAPPVFTFTDNIWNHLSLPW